MTAVSYSDFLARKQRGARNHGRDCRPADVHPMLHDWQREIVVWAVRKGRAALWEDTGLGKTIQQLEWARLSGDRALIVAPLAVCHQTVREAAKLGITARYAREDDGRPGIVVTNYEMADRFDPFALDAVVLDEASILKQSDGKTRTKLIGHFAPVPARLACTATPAPNDPEELTNQAEFLGVMPRVEMLAAYFVHDDQGWRLKGHAREPMYRWMTSWAVALRRPSDIGYPDDGYDLPALDIVPEVVDVEIEAPEGQLFAADLGGVGGRAQVRKQTLAERVERAAALVAAEPGEPWVLWCGLNAEADALAAAIPGAVNVHGSMTPEEKAELLLAFADGKIRHLVTKPSLASMGLNWQHCDIRESNTLNARAGREQADERHICPLQLDLIERCVRLWSNRGELVLSPFAGIGSEGYVAIEQGRRFVGVELKPSYWKAAVANLTEAESRASAPVLFEVGS